VEGRLSIGDKLPGELGTAEPIEDSSICVATGEFHEFLGCCERTAALLKGWMGPADSKGSRKALLPQESSGAVTACCHCQHHVGAVKSIVFFGCE
jgi:hypothetical protein